MSLSTHGQQSINRDTIKRLYAQIDRASERAHKQGHRAFLLFECKHTGDIALIRQWFDTQTNRRRMWVPEQSNTDRTDQIQQLLGTETQLVVYDATQGVDPRLLAASAGTLTANGLYFLISPPLRRWADTHDHEYDIAQSVFLHRLSDTLQSDCVPTPIENLWQLNLRTHSSEQFSANQCDRLTEQNTILDKLVNDVAAQVPHTIVIQADRGRGKSTLLARLLVSNRSPCTATVTALHPSATTVLRHYCAEHNYNVRFVPLQQALQQSHDLLLVDEAAMIPLDSLMTLASNSTQIVFATTVDGYEGCGRGFATRFAKLLDDQIGTWHLYQPQNPIRWHSGDKLEALFNKALLLKAELPPKPATPVELANVRCEQLVTQDLANDAQLLEHTFAILARAHYQTTAMDLRHMLDSPGLAIWIAFHDDLPCAAAIVCTEGEINENLYGDIIEKRRRLKHQLLPQLLTQFTLANTLLPLRYQRVVRIAVTPALQGRGIGSTLLGKIIDHGRDKVDAIGTSFGADDLTVNFWHRRGLTPAHLGYKRNPRSGLPALCMMLAFTDSAAAMQTRAQSLLHLNLQALIQALPDAKANATHDHYARLINIILMKTEDGLDAELPQDSFTAQQQLFANGSRNFLDSLAAIDSLLRSRHPQSSVATRQFEELAGIVTSNARAGVRAKSRGLVTAINALLQ